MKKLFNSRFLFILTSSLVVLIVLVLGAFYLFNDEDDVFLKSGYVLNPLSSTSEKYFFDESVGYKENLSSMIEFTDVDDKKVTVLKDSFAHYLDDSMSFLKKGAILDLDSINGDKAVSFYNITRDSIIAKKDNGYEIESASGDISLKNFIGRISDNKYIVVGDLALKLAGNSTSVKGDYFEIVYVEEGVVNIENKDVKYQVAADNTLIYVGNDKVIDLGNKKIMVNDVDVMSITAITIDGDENIEIIPKGNKDEDTDDDNSQNDGNNQGNQGNGNNNDNQEGNNNNQTPGDNTNDGNGGDNIDSDDTEEVVISLKDVTIGSTDISVVFDVVNNKPDDLFMLKVVNLSTGRTVDMTANVVTDALIRVNLLTPNTKYLFMVINEKDNGKYFQKVLETNGFGIKLEKDYATSSSLAYNIIVDEDTDISNAKLSMYRFNEETMKNEIVVDSYVDSVTGEVKTVEKVFNLSSLDNIVGEHQVLFDGLDSNTIYTAVLDEFSVASSNFKDIYNITVNSMTLKETPKFSEMNVTKDVSAGSFDLSLGDIVDPDNAIVSYTYMIYDEEDNSLAIEPIVNKNAAPITVVVGDKENQLRNDTNYYYKVIIEYYDNEKYIEYITDDDSIKFKMGNDPFITVIPNEELISYDTIGATIILRDNSCLISMPGREKCEGVSSTVVEVSRVNSVTGERTVVYSRIVDFSVSVEEIKYDLYVDKLQPGTTYSIEVRALFNDSNSLEKKEISHTDESKRTISTKSLSSFDVKWEDRGSNEDNVVNAVSKFVGIEGTGSMSPEESAASIKEVVISIYEGDDVKNLDRRLPIVEPVSIVNSDNFNIKENFYDKGYIINSLDTFGLTMQGLMDKNKNGELCDYYTILVEAYYDLDRNNKVLLSNNILAYKVNPQLLGEDVETVLEISEITNSKAGNIQSNLVNGGTVIGYSLSGSFDRNGLAVIGLTPKKLHFYVYNTYTKERFNFYTMNEDGELVLTENKKYTVNLTGDTGYFEDINIYMDYGTPYEVVDEIMRRGNYFTIGYEIESVDSEGNTWLNTTPSTANGTNGYVSSPTGYGVYKSKYVEKETPTLKMYVAKSTANTITYNYKMQDPDNAIYKEPESETFGFYTVIRGSNEEKIDMIPVADSEYNQFEGSFTIDGLTNGDVYSLYYKKNALKSGSVASDVLNYLEGYASGNRIFDGFYDLGKEADRYQFKYQIISDPQKDNRVVIKLLVDSSILDRILSYKVKFEDDKGQVIEFELGDKELDNLSVCPGDSDSATPRCLSVDYLYLKDMKSDTDKINNIRVNVTAIYDNGLTGYDYKVGSSSDDDYLYMIMQDNSSDYGMGAYIGFTASGQQVSAWNEKIGAVKGYYTYKLQANGNVFYNSMRYPNNCKAKPSSHCSTISTNLSSVGYSSKYGVLNPKMVSVDEMSCVISGTQSECNTFSFSSITPKVLVTNKASLINGAVVNLKLSGLDLEDIELEDNESYLYIETWENAIWAGKTDDNGNFLYKTVRPTVKVKIDKSNPSNVVSAVIDGLKEYTKDSGSYYFTVYAKLLKGIDSKGKPVYQKTQLYDAGITNRFETKIYNFKSAKTGDLFHSIEVSHSPTGEVYGNRMLTTKINLLAYSNNVPYNFDLIYVLCEVGDANTCGPDDGQSKIFKKVIPLDKITTVLEDNVDISEYDLEYGKEYHMWLYASTDYYDQSTGNTIKRNVVLNRYNLTTFLQKLTEPTFSVTRDALLVNGEYAIDFNVVPNDKDRTLVDGKYYVKLLNSDGEIVGRMQLKDSDGNYYDVPNYQDYAFDALTVNKNLRITGLEENTGYRFVVYNDVYINNYSEEIPKEERTYEVSKISPVYTTNNYGVAFGTATYGVTANAVVVTFLGGSNFNNVTEVNYTVGLWDDEQSTSTNSGTFVIGEDNKCFELYTNSEDWRFVIDPKGMKNVLGRTYKISISFKVKVPGTNNYVILTSADVPSFEGTVTYFET